MGGCLLGSQALKQTENDRIPESLRQATHLLVDDLIDVIVRSFVGRPCPQLSRVSLVSLRRTAANRAQHAVR